MAPRRGSRARSRCRRSAGRAGRCESRAAPGRQASEGLRPPTITPVREPLLATFLCAAPLPRRRGGLRGRRWSVSRCATLLRAEARGVERRRWCRCRSRSPAALGRRAGRRARRGERRPRARARARAGRRPRRTPTCRRSPRSCAGWGPSRSCSQRSACWPPVPLRRRARGRRCAATRASRTSSATARCGRPPTPSTCSTPATGRSSSPGSTTTVRAGRGARRRRRRLARTVAVIDTGLDVSHPEFAGQVARARSTPRTRGADVTRHRGPRHLRQRPDRGARRQRHRRQGRGRHHQAGRGARLARRQLHGGGPDQRHRVLDPPRRGRDQHEPGRAQGFTAARRARSRRPSSTTSCRSPPSGNNARDRQPARVPRGGGRRQPRAAAGIGLSVAATTPERRRRPRSPTTTTS